MLFDSKELQKLVKGKSKEEIFGEGGIFKSLVKGLLETEISVPRDRKSRFEPKIVAK